MDNKKIYSKENKLKSFIKFNSLSGSKLNLFQYNKNNSKLHEHFKFRIFTELIDNNYDVLVEPEFKNSLGRPDLIAFNKKTGEGTIFEIVCSESEKSISEKINKYPIEFNLEIVYTNKPIELTI